MKKATLVLCTLIFAMLVLSPFAFATEASAEYYDASLPRVIDEADLLTSEEEATLSELIKALTDKYNVDLVILTNYSLDGKTPMAFADDYYDYNGYGVGADKSGMLFLISMEARDYWTSTTGSCITYFSDSDIDSLGNDFLPDLKNGNYYYAFETYINSVDKELDYEINVASLIMQGDKLTGDTAFTLLGFAFSSSANKLFGYLIAGIIVALIVVYAIRSKMKPVKLQNYAGEYVDKDSFVLTNQSDTYLFTTTTRKRIPKQTTSSSRGGSSTHVGSSGTSHGGGGGKF